MPGSVGSQNEIARYASTAITARPAGTPERRERSDHPALDAADPAGKRQQAAERPEEVAHHEHGHGHTVAPKALNEAPSIAMSKAQ